MAKKQNGDKAVAKAGESALAAIPKDLQDRAGQGTENLRQEDIRPPRLLIAQSGSPQVKKGDPALIEGLAEGDLFNDLSQQNYGDKDLEFVVIKSLGARAVEFVPREEGGGIKDRDVPLSDPRCRWGDNGEKPVATTFYDFIVWLPQHGEMVALSMKSTAIKIAINLNSMTKQPLRMGGQILPNPPSWARTFVLSTAMEKNDQGSWANPRISLKPGDHVTDEETRQICAAIYDSLQGKKIEIEREDEPAGREPGSDDM